MAPLDDATYPYLRFDATHGKVREGGRTGTQTVVIAVGVRETGETCILEVSVGASETEASGYSSAASYLPGGCRSCSW